MLELDHENYDLLEEEVQSACHDNNINYDKKVFNSLLIEHINAGSISACIYDHNEKTLIPTKFDEREFNNYWFCRIENEK